jgi:hypothetical protein
LSVPNLWEQFFAGRGFSWAACRSIRVIRVFHVAFCWEPINFARITVIVCLNHSNPVAAKTAAVF